MLEKAIEAGDDCGRSPERRHKTRFSYKRGISPDASGRRSLGYGCFSSCRTLFEEDISEACRKSGKSDVLEGFYAL
jgi:hypothetical protein